MDNLNYRDKLLRLAINDSSVLETTSSQASLEPALDPRTLALVRIAALVAEGGPVASLGEHADAAIAAGATGDHIVEVLFALVPVLGLPCIVGSAPKMALALGFDVEEAL
jgi:4-carboxymuconolactone decarboxylase